MIYREKGEQEDVDEENLGPTLGHWCLSVETERDRERNRDLDDNGKKRKVEVEEARF